MSDSALTQRIKVLIGERHRGDPRMRDWTVFFELRDGTGSAGSRQAIDAFAMHTWPSKGYHRVGYEIKVSRSDFLREMKTPEKRAWAMEITHEFWFVAPAKVIDPNELPLDCGLLLVTANGDKLRTMKVAPHRQPRDLTMHEVAAFARKAHRQDVLSGARWLRSGRDLTDDDLAAILADERPRLEAEEFERRVQETADKRLAAVSRALKFYADALKKAGCEPPPWMEEGVNPHLYASEWSAEQWVAKHVSAGPGTYEVKAAHGLLRNAKDAVERALRQLDELAQGAQ